MTGNTYQGFAGITPKAAEVLEALGLKEPKGLARHWALTTPQGRAWLAYQKAIHQKGAY